MERTKVKPKQTSKIQETEKSSIGNDNSMKSNSSQILLNTGTSKKKRHRRKTKNTQATGIVSNREDLKQIESGNKNIEISNTAHEKKQTDNESKPSLVTHEKSSKTNTSITKNVLSCPVGIVNVPQTAEKTEISNISKPPPVIQEKSSKITKNELSCSIRTVKDPQKVETSEFSNISSETIIKMDSKASDKSRDEIKAEREAKKLAKQLAKNKPKSEKIKNVNDSADTSVNKSLKNASISVAAPASLPENNAQTVFKEKPISSIENKANVEEKKPTEVQEKSKSELRAERRAKQEAQRAAKAEQLTDKTKTTTDKKENIAPKKKVDAEKNKSLTDNAKIEMKKSIVADKSKTKPIQNRHKVKLFNHLYTEDENFIIPLNSKTIPPVIVRLGLQYKNHIIVGSNARCIALLRALRDVVKDFIPSPNTEFSRDLEVHLDECMKFLKSCRSLAVSMDNVIKFIKAKLRNMTHDTEVELAKSKLDEHIETYINEQIEVAGKAISNSVNKKIANGDVILTYGCSTLIEKILVDASAIPGKEFSVVVVAANPWNEGREMLRRLTAKNIDCSLIMISALSFVMQKINKVILGAGALLANGYVMARAGTAQVAMVAHAYNVPVLVCCETHKFSERALTDSFVYNEIGDPDALIRCNPVGSSRSLSNWRDIKTLTPLNLTYDVTPPDLVTAVVTELAILPCTSVPVVLRVKPNEAIM